MCVRAYVRQTHGHSYIGMGVAYGSSLYPGADLHPGAYSGSCYASNVGQWSSRFSSLEYTGGYHWPQSGGGASTKNKITYSRFQRRGRVLRQWYNYGADNEGNHPYPTTDEAWTSVSDYGYGSALLNAVDNCVILVGEAGGKHSDFTGTFKVMRYEGSPPPSPSAALIFYSTAGSGSGTDTWTPSMSAYSCAVVDRVFASDFDVVIKVPRPDTHRTRLDWPSSP